MKQSDSPEVSVRIVTYNHASFIGAALDSAINQKTNFKFEIVIGEDCSTDNTREVVKDYEARFPELLRVKYHTPNKGRQHNYYDTLSRCRGKYIALLDGDDYWISENKLQIQYDFLEANPNYPLCFHNNKIEWADKSQSTRTVQRDKTEYTAEDILETNYVTPSAAMFRSALIPEIPSMYDNVPFCDWPFYLAFARHGSLYAIPDILAVKRIQDEGVWTSMSKRNQLRAVVDFYEAVLEEGKHDQAEVLRLLKETQVQLNKRSISNKIIARLERIFQSRQNP